MPRNAAVSRDTPPSPPTPALQRVAVTLSGDDCIAAWEALVQRCGGPQAAFEALVLLPAALHAAGIDPERFLQARRLRTAAGSVATNGTGPLRHG